MLFQYQLYISSHLIEAFNRGILPQDWKFAHVTPIHKKGARNIVSNYQPVSLTSVYCKLMESIIKDHIMNHLLNNKLVSAQQFGFIPCTTQLLYVLDYFTHHLDKGHSIDVIYLDFQKAFNSVPHQWLLQKISSFGIHGKILMIFCQTDSSNLCSTPTFPSN